MTKCPQLGSDCNSDKLEIMLAKKHKLKQYVLKLRHNKLPLCTFDYHRMGGVGYAIHYNMGLQYYYVTRDFKISIAVKIWTVFFWVTMPYSLVGGYKCLRGMYYLQLQP